MLQCFIRFPESAEFNEHSAPFKKNCNVTKSPRFLFVYSIFYCRDEWSISSDKTIWPEVIVSCLEFYLVMICLWTDVTDSPEPLME